MTNEQRSESGRARRPKSRLGLGGARPPHGAGVVLETLPDQAHSTHEEARMVLPGIQALFGFQLIAVFQPPFFELDEGQRLLHLAALLLVAVAIALIMAPASYRRLTETTQISRAWICLASRCIAWAMAALMIAIAVDIYLVAAMVVHGTLVAGAVAGTAACLFGWMWFGLPLWRGPRDDSR